MSTNWIRLRSAGLSAEIDPFGAQLSVLRDGSGRDLLWNGDPAFWTGRAPILFPIVGELAGGRYRWRGASYALPRHGFARGRPFEVVRFDEGEALFRLRADDATRTVYPFGFELDIHFALADATLMVTATARNLGDDVMPASLGFHPAFRWPLTADASRESHFIEFEHDEPAPVRRLDARGLLRADPQPTPVSGRRLALDDSLFEQDVVIFDQLRSRRLHYGAGSHASTGARPAIELGFPDATCLGLWTKPGAGFVCIEPWRGIADPTGFSGELDAKARIEVLAPETELKLTMTIAVT